MNKKWDELEAGLDAIFNIESIEAQLAEANAVITTLRETLAFYRDEENYTFQNTYSMASEISKDKGQRARDALQKGE